MDAERARKAVDELMPVIVSDLKRLAGHAFCVDEQQVLRNAFARRPATSVCGRRLGQKNHDLAGATSGDHTRSSVQTDRLVAAE